MSQLLFQFDSIFRAAALPVWLRPYDILAVSASGGLIEAIPDTISLDALKKGDPHFTNLNDFFIRHFGRGNADSDAVKVCLFMALSLLVRGERTAVPIVVLGCRGQGRLASTIVVDFVFVCLVLTRSPE